MKHIAALFSLILALSANAEVSTRLKREKYWREIEEKVMNGEFKALEHEANILLLEKKRTDDGLWQLAEFYRGLDSAFQKIDTKNEKIENAIKGYANSNPNSSNAWLIYATALNSKAWAIRGPGFSNSVTPEAWSGFRRYTQLSKSVLDKHREISKKNPAWFDLRLDISMYTSEKPGHFNSIFNEGIKLEPTYHNLFFAKMRKLSPIWGGSIESMVDFMNSATKIQSEDGLAIYARLAWFAEGSGYKEATDSKSINWEKMKRAFMDIMEKYPVDWNAQKFFFMACQMSDKKMSEKLLGYIKEGPSEYLLQENISLYKMCIDWTKGKIPGFVIRNPNNGETKLIQ